MQTHADRDIVGDMPCFALIFRVAMLQSETIKHIVVMGSVGDDITMKEQASF